MFTFRKHLQTLSVLKFDRFYKQISCRGFLSISQQEISRNSTSFISKFHVYMGIRVECSIDILLEVPGMQWIPMYFDVWLAVRVARKWGAGVEAKHNGHQCWMSYRNFTENVRNTTDSYAFWRLASCQRAREVLGLKQKVMGIRVGCSIDTLLEVPGMQWIPMPFGVWLAVRVARKWGAGIKTESNGHQGWLSHRHFVESAWNAMDSHAFWRLASGQESAQVRCEVSNKT